MRNWLKKFAAVNPGSRMYVHLTKRTILSETCPSASFTVRSLSHGVRQRIAKRVLKRMNEEGFHATDWEGDDEAKAARFRTIIERAHFAEMLVAVHGLSIDGEPFEGIIEQDPDAALDKLLELAPTSLVAEIARAIRAEIEAQDVTTDNRS